MGIRNWMVFSLDVQPTREDAWDRDAIVRGFSGCRDFGSVAGEGAVIRISKVVWSQGQWHLENVGSYEPALFNSQDIERWKSEFAAFVRDTRLDK